MNPLILHASAFSRALKYILYYYTTIIIRRIEFKFKKKKQKKLSSKYVHTFIAFIINVNESSTVCESDENASPFTGIKCMEYKLP